MSSSGDVDGRLALRFVMVRLRGMVTSISSSSEDDVCSSWDMDDRLALRFVTAGFRGIITSILVGLTGSRSWNGVESTTMVSPSLLAVEGKCEG